jgi:hypothetical protein
VIRYERTPEGRLVALARVRVGVRAVTIEVDLGAWSGPRPDPGGLRGRPVVVVPEGATELAVVGARRAGRTEPAVLAPGPALAAALLRSTAEVLLVPGGTASTLTVARALGGRPIAAPPLPDEAAVRRLLEGCEVDVHVVLPARDEPTRRAARTLALGLGLERLHHLVEVDPAPGLVEPGADPGPAGLAAAAAGVLGGRLAAQARAWRP